jgi:hypothetical protein
MKRFFFAVLMALAAVLAFAGDSSAVFEADPSLIGRWKWISMKLLAVSVETGDNADDYILEFKEGGAMGVEADCRDGSGTYRTSGRTVLNMDLDSIDSTDCGFGSQADKMVDMLNEGSFEYSFMDGGSGLELKFAKGVGTAVFQKAD